ncbi:TonB-dependent receptor [Aliikangiella coralliicola]|uniref:TonB-dependent receptor n=1 Tax=Aliikangiella coralliicola TaxID=2592383 RepID=A0A545U7W8_9GAMM|nr:TonB-dependent receptor [Aliikangiella coralliicola]TQV85572.1 TonB-dependent receptor [Aliikangiella coralliicola]
MKQFSFSATSLVVAAVTGAVLTTAQPAYADDVADDAKDYNRIVVTAELTDTNVLDLPASVTVIDEETIEQNNAQHLADLLNLAPNVNFATGASRGRFVQIRGIGERSEFVEPVNYSVGVVVDGIDLTGIATAATTLDIQQVEILRGPQGTLYGANGLAGLINLVSNSPTDTFYSKLTAGVEEFGGRNLSAVVSGPVSDKLGYRLAIGHYQSDGFMNNQFLNRDDTNNIDESSLRAKFVYEANQALTVTSSILLVDVDNGYDAFSLDSNRTTYSDQPGNDRQETSAASFHFDWQLNEKYRLESLISFADSDLEYGFDEDWSHPGICDNTPCDSALFGFDWWYASFDNYTRENQNNSIDLRLHSGGGENVQQGDEVNWVLGLYYRDQSNDLNRIYTFNPANFSSQFDTTNVAVYGQVSTPFSPKLTLVSGLRFENRQADYSDSDLISFKPDEDLWGGKVSLEYRYESGKMIYGLISRGYKAGGFNADGTISVEEREFDTEFMWNYEAGIKGNWLEDQLTLQASIFYQDRDDIQIKQSIVRSLADGTTIQEGGACPCSFTDFTDNAAQAASYGLEVEAQWRGWDEFQLYTTLGLLKSEFKNFQSFSHVLADQQAIPPVPFNLDGRAVAHAPEHQLVVGLNYFINDNWTFNSEIQSKGDFYFSDRHEEKSDGYEILNLGLVYSQDNWRINLFARNLADKDIQTRGFGSFGNDPRNFYETEAYYQFAAPRVVGVSASLEFE